MAKYEGAKRKALVDSKHGGKVTRIVGSNLSVTSNVQARDAFNPRPAKPTPQLDIFELEDAVTLGAEFDGFEQENVRRAGSDGDGVYVQQWSEVIKEDDAPVIILHSDETRYLFDDYVYAHGSDEAQELASETFEACQLTVDVERAQTLHEELLATASLESRIDQLGEPFTEIRERVERAARRAGIDLTGIEIREEREIEFEDETADLGDLAQKRLDDMWNDFFYEHDYYPAYSQVPLAYAVPLLREEKLVAEVEELWASGASRERALEG